MKTKIALVLLLVAIAGAGGWLGGWFGGGAEASASPPKTKAQTAAAQDDQAKAWLGVSISDVTAQVAKQLGIDENTKGAVVRSLLPNSPASTAGVQQWDVITAVDGAAIANVADLQKAIAAKKPGDSVKLTVLRAGKSQDIQVALGTAPAAPAPKTGTLAPKVFGHGFGFNFFGLRDELKDIPANELFSHIFGGDTTVKNKDGQVVTVKTTFGKVTKVEGTTVTVQPNSGGATVAFKTNDTTVVGKGGKSTVGDLKADDQVVVVSKGDTATSILVVGDLGAGKLTPRSGQRMPFRGWGGSSSGVPRSRAPMGMQ